MKKTLLLLSFSCTALFADFGITPQVEFHSKYQNLDFGLTDAIVYARFDGANSFSNGWQIYSRLDLPYMWLWGKQTEIISIDLGGIVAVEQKNQSPKTTKKIKKTTSFKERGFSDILTRAFFVTPPLDSKKRVTCGFGSELTFPTAQKVDLGTGKYAARPMVGLKYDLPNLGISSWVAGLLKYQFSYAGSEKRDSYQIFFIQPVFIYGFKKGWTLAITPEIQYNVLTHKWFIPAPITLTRTITDHFSLTAAYQKGIVTAFPVFNQEVELTMRYTF